MRSDLFDLVSFAVLMTRCIVDVFCIWSISRVLGLPFRLSNPFIVVWIFSLPILVFRLFVGPLALIEDGFSNIYFQKAVLIEAVSLLSGNLYLVLLLLFGQKAILRIFRPMYSEKSNVQVKYYSIVGSVFLALGILSVLLLASQQFGVANWILSPRQGYQYYRSAEGHWYTLAVNCLAVGASLILLFSGSPIAFILGVIPVTFLVYLLGSKAFFLQFAAFIIIALLFKRVRIALYLVPVIGAFAGFGMLQNFAQAGFSSSIKNVAQYFDYFRNSMLAVRLFDLQYLDYFYGEILRSSYWGSVPRALVPSKPYVYGILNLNEILWPGLAKMGHTPAFSGGIDGYADLGWWGVIIQPFIGFGTPFLAVVYVLTAAVYRDFLKLTPTPIGILAVVVAFAPGVLSFLGFPWNFIWLFCVLLALMIARPLRKL